MFCNILHFIEKSCLLYRTLAATKLARQDLFLLKAWKSSNPPNGLLCKYYSELSRVHVKFRREIAFYSN